MLDFEDEASSAKASEVGEDWFEDGVISTGGNGMGTACWKMGLVVQRPAEMSRAGSKMESLAQELERVGRACLKKTAAVQNPVKMGRTG